LSAYLKYLGKREFDALVLTHGDGDHSAGAKYVTGKFRAKEIWDNGLLLYPDSLKNNSFRHLERGDVIEAAGFTVHVLHPYKGFYTFADNEAFSENNDSLVLKVTGRGKSFLFSADTAEEAEEDMLHLGKWLKSDVIKVAHHGSRTSTTDDFLNAVAPEIAVISVGRHNSYGHPTKETLERLNGTTLFRTDRDGAIKITEISEGLAVKTYRGFLFEKTRSISGELRNIKRLFAKW
jgi:competence protein ComEC